MLQFNPTHQGKFIERVYLNPIGLRSIDVARSLKISSSAFSRLIHGKSRVTLDGKNTVLLFNKQNGLRGGAYGTQTEIFGRFPMKLLCVGLHI